jgi:hypothetical protein
MLSFSLIVTKEGFVICTLLPTGHRENKTSENPPTEKRHLHQRLKRSNSGYMLLVRGAVVDEAFLICCSPSPRGTPGRIEEMKFEKFKLGGRTPLSTSGDTWAEL